MESQLKASIVMKAMDILGNIVHTHLTRPDLQKVRELQQEYYEKLKELTEKEKELKRQLRERRRFEEIEEKEEGKEEKGTACLACSKAHFSTVSAALNEALRFARSEGIKHKEVIRRIGIALDELVIMERIDLAADKIARLSEKEREVAEWALKKAREIRHKIDEIRTVKDLEDAAALAAEVRTEFLDKLFDLYGKVETDDIVHKVCSSIKDEKEKEECEKAVREFIEKRGMDISKYFKKEECVTCPK